MEKTSGRPLVGPKTQLRNVRVMGPPRERDQIEISRTDEVELGLEKVIPSEFMLHAHHWLILHGRYTCLARKPRCEVCLINDLCRWPEKTV